MELDTTIDWFKYLDDESTGVYDFGDKCLKKHRAVGSIRYSRISFKSCAWKRNFYYDSHVVSILMTYEELNFILPIGQVFLPKMSNMSIQSKSKEFVDEENDNPTSNNNSERGDALDTILKSQLEIINPVRKDIASENKINKLIIVQVKKTNEFFEDHCRRLPNPQRFRH